MHWNLLCVANKFIAIPVQISFVLFQTNLTILTQAIWIYPNLVLLSQATLSYILFSELHKSLTWADSYIIQAIQNFVPLFTFALTISFLFFNHQNIVSPNGLLFFRAIDEMNTIDPYDTLLASSFHLSG